MTVEAAAEEVADAEAALDEAWGEDSAGVGDGYLGGATGTEPGKGSWDV